MAYDNQQTYNKFNADSGCSCEDKSSCSCGCNEQKCGCCPIGLVEVKDADGKHVACLSPSDAQEYMSKTYRCPDGYIRVVASVGGEFIGCLTPEEFAAYSSIVP